MQYFHSWWCAQYYEQEPKNKEKAGNEDTLISKVSGMWARRKINVTQDLQLQTDLEK